MKRALKIVRAAAIVVAIIGVPVGLFFVVKMVEANRAAAEAAARVEVATPVEVAPARRGDIVRTFTVTGSIEADAESGVVAKIPGKVTRVHVDEGAYVHRGQLLVELERGDLSAQLRQARAAVAAAEARLKQAETGTGLQEAQTSAGIEAAEAALASARARLRQVETGAEVTQTQTTTSIQQAREAVNAANARLDMVVEGARTQQVEQADEAVKQAKASLDTARTNLRRAGTLLAQGAMAQQQYDAAKLQFDVAQAQYNSARQQLDLVREGPRSQEVEMARAQVEQAKSALVLAEANQAQNRISQQEIEAAREGVRSAEASLKLARASTARNYISREDVQAARAALNQARANVAYIQTQIGYTCIRAPMLGVVTRRSVDPGEGAMPSVPLLTITDNNSVFVRANLPEMELANAAIGQQVTATVDALAEEEFIGEITEVIPSADLDTRTFDIKVRIGNADGRLKQGMFARVVVVTARTANAIIVPRVAVIKQQGQQVVYVAEHQRAKRVPVETGLNDETNIAITDGVKERDMVIVSGQTLLKPDEQINMVERHTGAGR